MSKRRVSYSEPISVRRFDEGLHIQGKCPYCHRQFTKIDSNFEFNEKIFRSPSKCGHCAKYFDLGPQYSLPWLNYVPMSVRLYRSGRTGEGASTFDQTIIEAFSHAITVGHYGENRLQPNSYHICRFDSRINSELITAEYFEIIFFYHDEEVFTRHMFSDDPNGAEARYVELNPDVQIPWKDGLIQLHTEMGFPDGIPFQPLWDEFQGII